MRNLVKNHRDKKWKEGCQGLERERIGSYCLMGIVSVLKGEKSSRDGWWLWLYDNMNVLTTTEMPI